jgi:hypothetical protein
MILAYMFWLFQLHVQVFMQLSADLPPSLLLLIE